MDARYQIIKTRLSTLSKAEIKAILDNIDNVCFDEFNYDEENNKFCPLAIALDLQKMENPTDFKVKEELSKRFNPVNIIKGVEGEFYRNDRKNDMIKICTELLQ